MNMPTYISKVKTLSGASWKVDETFFYGSKEQKVKSIDPAWDGQMMFVEVRLSDDQYISIPMSSVDFIINTPFEDNHEQD